MSLIVARKHEENIIIVSDTKLTYPDEDGKRQKDNPADGVLKSVIIRDDVCVSFSGELDHAVKALALVNKDTPLENILDILLLSHNNSGSRTDYIVCSSKPPAAITEIKNGALAEVQAAWIGSQNGFNLFQNSANSNGNNKQNGLTNISLELALPGHLPKSWSKLYQAMDEVINSESVPEVGGFKVNVLLENGVFRYNGYIHMYSNPLVPKGYGSFIIGHASAEEGGYTINFVGSTDDYCHVAIHIKQGNFGILYSLEKGMMYPNIEKNMDEVDFYDFIKDNYGFKPNLSTQSRHDKFFRLAQASAIANNFNEALKYLDKAISDANSKQKAEIYFHKGIALFNLGNPSFARSFQDAIDIDSAWQPRIMSVLLKAKRR